MTAFLHIAQRGGRGLLPENTLAAFANAIQLGCDGASLGVHLTKDDRVVVHESARLNPDYCRAADGSWISRAQARTLRELTYNELQQYDIGRPDPASRYSSTLPFVQPRDGARIPLLSEVLDLVQSSSEHFVLVIDLKTPIDKAQTRPWLGLVEAVLDHLQRRDFVRRAVLTSRDWGSLVHAKRLLPGLCTWFATLPSSWLCEGSPPSNHAAPDPKYLEQLRALAKDGCAPWCVGFDPRQFRDVPAAVRAAGGDGWLVHFSDFGYEQAVGAHREGMPAIVWSTARTDPVLVHRMLAAGAGGFCGDYPDLRPTDMAIDISPVLERAGATYRERKWPDAITYYKYVVDHFPRHAQLDVFIKLAVAQRGAKDFVGSAATLDACQLGYPQSRAALVELAVLHMHTADWRKALEVWEKLLNQGALSALNYNRAARTCEVLQRWDLHARIVQEGLSRFPKDRDLRSRLGYSVAQASLADRRWAQAIALFESVEIPGSWPFAVSLYRKQAQIELALQAASTDSKRAEILRTFLQSRTALPWPWQLAGISNALDMGRRSASMDEKLVEALLALVDVMRNYDTDLKSIRNEWMAARVADVAEAATPEAIASLSLPAPYWRATCRALLRFGHLQPYWLCREKCLESLARRRIGARDAVSHADLVDQVVWANECGDHDYFAGLTEAAATRLTDAAPERLVVVEVSRLYHTRPPLDWHGPFDEADRRFAQLVVDKSVALVGPVASDVDQGEEIDGFDLVVRFNHRKSVRLDPPKFGSRTDLSWYLHSDLPAVPQADFVDGMNDLAFVVLDKWCWKQCPWLSEVKAPKRGRLECWHEHNNPLLFGSPNGLQRTLLDLLRFNVKRVKVFNSNLFLNTQYGGGYRAPQKNLFTMFSLHDPVGNFVFLKRLRDLGTIETDAVLGEILSMSSKDYVDALDVRYGQRAGSLSSGS